jgi:hypothetical protein
VAPRVHMKGRLLQILAESGPKWDYEVASQLIREYGLEESAYWHGQTRLQLADLHSGGLVDIDESQDTVDPTKTFGREKLVRVYDLTPFGRERMRMTELLPAGTARPREV